MLTGREIAPRSTLTKGAQCCGVNVRLERCVCIVSGCRRRETEHEGEHLGHCPNPSALSALDEAAAACAARAHRCEDRRDCPSSHRPNRLPANGITLSRDWTRIRDLTAIVGNSTAWSGLEANLARAVAASSKSLPSRRDLAQGRCMRLVIEAPKIDAEPPSVTRVEAPFHRDVGDSGAVARHHSEHPAHRVEQEYGAERRQQQRGRRQDRAWQRRRLEHLRAPVGSRCQRLAVARLRLCITSSDMMDVARCSSTLRTLQSCASSITTGSRNERSRAVQHEHDSRARGWRPKIEADQVPDRRKAERNRRPSPRRFFRR